MIRPFWQQEDRFTSSKEAQVAASHHIAVIQLLVGQHTHKASVCTQSLTPVPAWVRETPSSTPRVNTFHPVQQSRSESLNKSNCTLPGIRFFNYNNPNPIKHPHCKLRMIQGQSQGPGLQPDSKGLLHG